MLDEKNLETLLVEAHDAIREGAESVIAKIGVGNTDFEIVYPSPGRLSGREARELSTLKLSTEARSGLELLLADAVGRSFFRFLALIDGVGDPMLATGGLWTGADLVPKSGTWSPMLHDLFFDTYSRYKRLHDANFGSAPPSHTG